MDDQPDPTLPPSSSDEVRCPQCAVVVQPTWDWCHGCGYDPDGLRPAATDASADPPPAPEPEPTGRLRRRRYRT